MKSSSIPKAEYALIGGSGTWGARFPEDLDLPDVELIEYLPRYETPDGLSAPFKLLTIKGAPVLRVAMHGCYPNPPNHEEHIPPGQSSHQVAWVLRQAGVKYVIVEGSVGGIQHRYGTELYPWSVAILSDFYHQARNYHPKASPANSEFYRLGRPFCQKLSKRLAVHAKTCPKFKCVIEDAAYVCTEIGRFESPFEINTFRHDLCNVVGQTISHEAIALKYHGIPHFAALTIVSNIAETGVSHQWTNDHLNAMAEFYHECPQYVAPVVVSALASVIESGLTECDCDQFALSGLSQFPVQGA